MEDYFTYPFFSMRQSSINVFRTLTNEEYELFKSMYKCGKNDHTLKWLFLDVNSK